jgi:hypothetical protein
MKPLHRSLSGLLIAIVSAPIFMGLLACLPVPIGDPEKSRIDADLSGIWFVPDEPSIVLIEPYDKRTWIITIFEATIDEKACPEEDTEELSKNDYEVFVGRIQESDGRCFKLERVEGAYKVWRVKLGGQQFMTWEPKGGFDKDHGFGWDVWFVYRIDKANKDEFTLSMINSDYDGFEDPSVAEKFAELKDQGLPYDPRKLKAARRAAEKVIRRNAVDDELYMDELKFYRVQPEHYDLFELIEDLQIY